MYTYSTPTHGLDPNPTRPSKRGVLVPPRLSVREGRARIRVRVGIRIRVRA